MPPAGNEIQTWARPLDDAPDDVIGEASRSLREDHDRELGRRLATRLIVAFGLIVAVAAVMFAVLPAMGLTLPPTVYVLVFGTIAVGAFMAHAGDHPGREREPRPEPEDPGRPIGCCPGPSTLRCFREPGPPSRDG